MVNEDWEPEFQNKLRKITGKIRSTNFDKDNLELYHATLASLFSKYEDYFDHYKLLNILQESASESDPIKFESALEMIEDVFL